MILTLIVLILMIFGLVILEKITHKKKPPFQVNCARDGLAMTKVRIASGESSEMYECSLCKARYFRGHYYSPEAFKILIGNPEVR